MALRRLLLALLLLPFLTGMAEGPLTVSSTNSRYFETPTGRIVVLAGSHTWENLIDQGRAADGDPPTVFNFATYVAFLKGYGHNFTKAWVWENFRLSPNNADGQEYLFGPPLPYERHGSTCCASDGGNKYDLTNFDEVYFNRLYSRIAQYAVDDIYVDVILFQPWSQAPLGPAIGNPWPGSIYNDINNVQGLDGDTNSDGSGTETFTYPGSGDIPALVAIQEAYIEHVVDTLNSLPNVLYEISNENCSAAACLAWTQHMADYLNTYQATKPNQHPIGVTTCIVECDTAVLAATNNQWIATRYNGTSAWDGTADHGPRVSVQDSDHYGLSSNSQTQTWREFLQGHNPLHMNTYDCTGAQYANQGAHYDCPGTNAAQEEGAMVATGLIGKLAPHLDMGNMVPNSGISGDGYALADTVCAGAGCDYIAYTTDGAVTLNLSAAGGQLMDVYWMDADDGTLDIINPQVNGNSGTALTCPAAMSNNCVVLVTQGDSEMNLDPIPMGPVFTNYNWRPMKIGGGGYLTGMDISPDGTTRVVRTDTYGAYLWNGSAWQQLMTASSMPVTERLPGLGQGVYEIRVAPSDPTRLYMVFDGYVFKSTDRGAHWTRTSFSPVLMEANYNDIAVRAAGEKMAVDPINPDVVYLGTQEDGLWSTADGGTNWGLEVGVPSSGYITGIVFDPAGGSTGGKTNTIYAAVAGAAVYRSTDVGANWTALSGGPSVGVVHGLVQGGVYYATSHSGALWRYEGAAWDDFTPGGFGSYHSIAADPFNAGHLVFATESANMHSTNDGGDTFLADWFYTPSLSCSGTGATWLCVDLDTAGISQNGGALVFDPVVEDRLWLAGGTTPWYTTLGAPPTVVWNAQPDGIEELVANTVTAPPGGVPVVANWDFGLFRIADPNAYATTLGPTPPGFGAVWHVDWASTDPTFLIAFECWGGSYGASNSSTSSNGGSTWTPFPALPVAGDCESVWGREGSGAAASTTNWIWVPGRARAPYRTTNGGSNWTKLSLPGVADNTTDGGWAGLYPLFPLGLARHIIAADRVEANTFYIYHCAETVCHGIFKSTDSGATWTLVHAGQLTDYSFYNAKLKSVPGQAGHLFFTAGPQGVTARTTPIPADTPFMRSIDGGANWISLTNVKEVHDFGFGKEVNGYPTILIAGWVDDLWGLWRSTDQGLSWERLGDEFFGDSFDIVKTVDGDKTSDRVYVGFGGSGYLYGEPEIASGLQGGTLSGGRLQ